MSTPQDINAAPENREIPQETPRESVQEPEVRTPKEPGRFVTYAIVSIVLTVAAWIAANMNGYVAIACSVAAIVAGAMALRSRRHGVRNTAITAIIAAAVLLVVITAFIIVIFAGLKSI